jgi:hypothetical protein
VGFLVQFLVVGLWGASVIAFFMLVYAVWQIMRSLQRIERMYFASASPQSQAQLWQQNL